MGTALQQALGHARARLAGLRARRRRANDLDDLARRVEYLEAALEALQDSTYRQDVMHDAKIAALGSKQRADER